MRSESEIKEKIEEINYFLKEIVPNDYNSVDRMQRDDAESFKRALIYVLNEQKEEQE